LCRVLDGRHREEGEHTDDHDNDKVFEQTATFLRASGDGSGASQC
jgi:hypothetical protein